MISLPSADRIFQAMDATWCAAHYQKQGNITLREGVGGGKRVSAATVDLMLSLSDLKSAETQMRAWGQNPMFMVRGGQEALDTFLHDQAYTIIDPVVTLAADCKTLFSIDPPPLSAIPSPEPLAMMAELWAQGGISQARIDVMKRVTGPKTYLISRFNEGPGGCAFVACDRDVAMVHALEVVPDSRRAGVGRNLLGKAARWAAENGAKYISLVTTGENLPAQNLFTGVGMTPIGSYHYRVK